MSRAEDRYYAAIAAWSELHADRHRAESVVASDRDEHRDARRFDRASYRRVSGVLRDVDDLPAKGDE